MFSLRVRKYRNFVRATFTDGAKTIIAEKPGLSRHYRIAKTHPPDLLTWDQIEMLSRCGLAKSISDRLDRIFDASQA